MDGGTVSPRGPPPAKATPFRKPVVPTPLKSSVARKSEIFQAKLPIGSATPKTGTPRGDREDKTPSKESSPRADMKKASSFVESCIKCCY
ncbi:hypothetical protein SK128_011833 [Halocaridina rubra]|uniref:Uncharacterized protein n=1 Tax=Halocaridina rubra TaxID=373956 RepID=A0AAN8WZA9_HALRR